MTDTPTLSDRARHSAIMIVLVSTLLWAFWWYPVRMIEAHGPTGAWVGVVMCGAALALCLPLLVLMPGKISSRGVLGALLVGVAVIGYTVSVSYTVFVRAVLIFYIAPAWSLMIECFFFGRKWTLRALASILAAFIGLALISRGEVSFDGVGAIGDWMALFAGMAWSAGVALIFSARAADFSWAIVVTLIGAVLAGLALIAVFGGPMGIIPGGDLASRDGLIACAIGGTFLAFVLGCTMWGAVRLPPTVMSYLLSIEIVAGVAVSAIILGEQFGLYEFFGASFVIGAVLLELTRSLDPQSAPEL